MGTRGPQRTPRADRFWARVDRSQPDGCWEWTAGRHGRYPYGLFYDDDRRGRRAHRIAYELTHGVVLAPEQVVRHSCDNPPCCRPDHLSVGTQMENLADMRQRGRDTSPPVHRGRNQHKAVLTEDMVRAARRLRSGGGNISALARQYGVRPATLLEAARGGSWRHVP